MLGGDIQWGRFAEVTFTNFDTGLVTTIKSDEIDNNNQVIREGLRVAFDYSKNDDEGYNSPNGKIIIYGLTEKTFNSVGERLRCEIEVKAGYLKSKKNSPKRIFYAVLMDKSYEMQEGLSVSTFTVLGDFIEKVISAKMSLNLPKPTLLEIFQSIAQAMNKGWGVKLDGSDEDVQMLTEYLQSWRVSPFGYSFANTPQEELKRLRTAYGIAYRTEKDAVIFSILDDWYNWHLDGARQISQINKQRANTSLVAENKTAPEVKDTKDVENSVKNINLIKTHALVLSNDTGLIGTPILKTVIADKDYDAALGEGEEVWAKKEQKVIIDKKTGKPRVDKKTGQVRMTKKAKTMKVARRTVVAKCFINSMLDFNSQVSIITETGICDGIYRVRSIKISGDTGGTEWYMELELNE